MATSGSQSPRIPWEALPRADGSGACEVAAIENPHFRLSREMIIDAAGRAPLGGRVNVIGAGTCRDIPVDALTRRFDRVTLKEYRATLLETCRQDLVGIELFDRIEFLEEDVTGASSEFAAKSWDRMRGTADPAEALSCLGELLVNVTPETTASSQEPVAMTVSSCVLSQLNLPYVDVIGQLITKAFGVDLGRAHIFRELQWPLESLLRRLQAFAMDRLYAETSPDGVIYLSDTMDVAYFTVRDATTWVTDGARAARGKGRLEASLDPRFDILDRGEWSWVNLPAVEGARGSLWRIEALALRRDSAEAVRG